MLKRINEYIVSDENLESRWQLGLGTRTWTRRRQTVRLFCRAVLSILSLPVLSVGPDDSVIRLIGFVPITYQRGSQGKFL